MDRLPNAEQATLDHRKVTDYLLSSEHPFGRSKARFFLRFGFRLAASQDLRSALLDHARRNAVALRETTPFGLKYVVEGLLASPDGRNPMIRSIWIVESGHDHPRFVTAYPLEGSQP